jgi:hypothetical protein
MDPPYDLGVLFVHGIGNQPRGSTLTDFGTPLIERLRSQAKASGATASVRAASLVRDDDEPARAELDIGTNTRSTRWLLAESWWAASFPGARFSDVARWGLVIVPWAIGSHFAKRLSQVEGRKHGGVRWVLSFASALMTLVGGLLLSPFLLLMLSIMLLLGKIPIPQLQSALSQLQSPIASSLGDSYMLVTRPIEAAAIQAKILADLKWLTERCKKVAVIAHSQGAALAARVVSNAPDFKGLLITFGSGLRKVEELEAVRDEAWMTRGAWLTVAGIVFTAIAVTAAPVVIVQALKDHAAPVSVLSVLGMGAVAALIAALGLVELLRPADPANLKAIVTKLRRDGIDWIDLYASADPVPNGALHDDSGIPPHAIEVTNFGSVWSDHTAYWANHDEFVGEVAEKLVAFDSQVLAQGDTPLALIAKRRRTRIAALRWVQWVTVLSAGAMLVRYRADWLQVAAWTSKRGLGWLAGLVGWPVQVGDVPAVQVWRQSVGWLVAILTARWITRAAWNAWNARAMKNGPRDPVGLLLAFWAQSWLAAYLISPTVGASGWGSGLSFVAMFVMGIATVQRPAKPVANPLVASPQVASPQQEAEPRVSLPERAGRAIWNLGSGVAMIVTLVWFYLSVVPRFLAEHLGSRYVWGIGLSVALLIVYAVVRERRRRR